MLLFVGSWRSTLIVATSIPLSILSSILVLSWLGQTINVMTLGGLALAVGILVDDATVMIENINTHLEEADADGKHKGLERAIIDAANQIVVPTFVSTLCICIVWLPLLQLGGVAGYLFLPLAEAIIFAMIASFILSRTLTPTMAAWLLRGQVAAQRKPAPQTSGLLHAVPGGVRGALRAVPRRATAPSWRGLPRAPSCSSPCICAAALASLLLLLFVGQDFFPSIKSGEIDLHMRAPIGTRIEEAGKISVLVEQQIRDLLPGHVVGTLMNCGLPVSGINQAYSNTGTVGSQDCDITISLDNQAAPVDRYRQILRAGLTERFPGTDFSFLPGDITAKILNFGLPSPIDVQISGRDLDSQFCLCHETDGATEADRRHRRCAHPAGHGPADPAARVAAHLRPGDRPDGVGYRRQHPGTSCREAVRSHRPTGSMFRAASRIWSTSRRRRISSPVSTTLKPSRSTRVTEIRPTFSRNSWAVSPS